MVLALAEISEYLTLNSLPWLLLAWASIYISRPFASIIHELGHAISAVIFTSETVQIKVGVGQGSLNFSIKLLKLEISFKKMIFGCTAFQDANLSNIQLALIYATGPIFSFLASAAGLWFIYTTTLHVVFDALLVGWICSNLLCLFRNLLPLQLQGPDSKSVPSDGLQILRIIMGKLSRDLN
tara:strand:- start:245 stop:790 length:546 start_codon:yes stop_codon:yes gene_type:complete